MARMSLTAGVSQDRESVLIELLEEDKPLGHIIADAASLDALISELTKCRAMLTDEVTPGLDPGSRLEPERSPAWLVDAKLDPAKPDVMLALRHPGHGWLSFLLEPERARNIAAALVARLKPPDNSP